MKSPRQVLLSHEPLVRRSLLLIAMYAGPLLRSVFQTARMEDPDIWWHLRTGQWIMESKTVPLADTFSIMEGTPWIAYSWLYEILIAGFYQAMGPSGFIAYAVCMALLVTFCLYSLLRMITGGMVPAIVLTVVGITAMSKFLFIRSFMLSCLFLIIEMIVIHRARTSSRYHILLVLPPLFLLWANIHIHFVVGLFVYAVMMSDIIWEYFKPGANKSIETKRHLSWMLGIWGGCVLGTLFTPYHIFIYKHLLTIAGHKEFYEHITELQSPSFKSFPSWVLLVISMGAIFTVGLKRMKQPSLIILLAFAVFVSFRSGRDAWIIIIIGLTVIGSGLGLTENTEESRGSRLLVASGILVAVLVSVQFWGISNEALEKRLAEKYPAGAAEFIDQQGYSGPIFNHFNWGGYLIWRLPQCKVSMDGRGYLYGGDMFEKNLKAWGASPEWKDNSLLFSSGLIVANPDFALTTVLRRDPQFELVYEDDVSLVFKHDGSDPICMP